MRVDRLEATGAVAFLAAAAIFAVLAWGVETRTPLVLVDAEVTKWMVAHRTDGLTSLMLGISRLHEPGWVGFWAACFGLVLWRRDERYWLMTLALTVGGGMLLNQGLKLMYRRARPMLDDPLVMLHSFSFPSGHTAGATLFYGVLAAYLVYVVKTRAEQSAVIAGAIVMVLLVASSRVYLGAHYLSDVAAAACSSMVWLMVCLVGGHGLVRRRMEGR